MGEVKLSVHGGAKRFFCESHAVSKWRLASQVPLGAAGLCWVLLWLNLNSGPWHLRGAGSLFADLNAIRASLVFVVSAFALVHGVSTYQPAKAFRSSLFCLKIYSLLALCGSAFSLDPFTAFYFGSAQLAAILVWEAVMQTEKRRENNLANALAANLLIATVYAAGVVYFGREVIFGAQDTAYHIIGEIDEVAGMPMSRASGVARFAAVPAITAFALLWRSDGWRRLLFAAVFLLSAFVIYRMQSRGALFAGAAALACIAIMSSGRYKFGAAFVIAAGAFAFVSTGYGPGLVEYLMRGQDHQEFISFSGRTRAWHEALAAVSVSPVIGSGNFADRLLTGEHSHNALLQALLFGGIAGLVPFLGSWFIAWKNLIRVWTRRNSLDRVDQKLVLIAGGLLAFFSVRSIPETTTASFSVDLMVMIPVLGYLDELRVNTHARVDGPPKHQGGRSLSHRL